MASKTTNGQGTAVARALTAEEQKELVGLHRQSAAEIAALARPGEGFERVAPDALAALGRHPSLAKVMELDPAKLEASFEEGRHLATLEAVAYDLYRRAFENRLEHESEVYRALLKANRVAHSLGQPDVEADFSALDAWISSTHPGRPAGAASSAEPPPAGTPPGRAPAPAAAALPN